MADETATLKDFLNSSLRPVLSTRLYLLNKPCSLCHLGTNIRVSKPTCSHRICSSCLAHFETSNNEGKSIECPACSTYWFTLQSSPSNPDETVPTSTNLLLHLAQRSKEIERQIFGEKNLPAPSMTLKQSTQNPDSKAAEHPGHIPDLPGDTTTLTLDSSSNSPRAGLRERDGETSKPQVGLPVPIESGTSCRSLITNDTAVKTPVTQKDSPLKPHISRISSYKIRSAMKSNGPEFKPTELRSVRFDVAEVPTPGQPIEFSQRMSLKATESHPKSNMSRKKLYFNLIWPAILLILGGVLFECIGSVLIRFFLSPIV